MFDPLDGYHLILSVTHLLAGALVWGLVGERWIVPAGARWLQRREREREKRER